MSQSVFSFMKQDSKDLLDTSAGLVLKVLVLSIILSVAIKYIGPILPIPATNTAALVIALTPTFVMGLALAWRGWQQR